MAEQLRSDRASLKSIDLDWLRLRMSKWKHKAKHHLNIMLERLVLCGEDGKYSPGSVASGGTIQTVLARNLVAANALRMAMCDSRKAAWGIIADGLPDIYEHAIQDMEAMIGEIETQQRLIIQLGPDGYVSARLEDA